MYEWQHYELGKDNLFDYDAIEKQVLEFKPKLVVAGYSNYPHYYDYKRMKEICDKVGAILMSDMAHISGLVAAQLCPDPFLYSDIVTTTTHKTLRGPRGSIIFAKKNFNERNLFNEINEKVFPGLQGGPHNHTIAAIATALKDTQSKEFYEYQKQVIKNAQQLAISLQKHNFEIVTGGTSNHMVCISLKKQGIHGGIYEHVLNKVNISANKNTLSGDLSALKPSGMRLGSPAMTTRGCKEEEFVKISDFLSRAAEITQNFNKFEKLIDFKKTINQEFKNGNKDLNELYKEVKEFSEKLQYHIPSQFKDYQLFNK